MWCDALRPSAPREAGVRPDAWTAAPVPILLFCGWALPVAAEPAPPKADLKRVSKRRRAA